MFLHQASLKYENVGLSKAYANKWRPSWMSSTWKDQQQRIKSSGIC